MTTEPYGKKNPFPARVLDRKHITAKNSPKETIHIEFDLDGSGLDYVSGDALAVIPSNDPEVVDLLIETLQLDPEEQVTTPDGGETTLRNALINEYDITGVNKGLMTKWHALAGSAELLELLDPDHKEALANYCWGADLIDLATDYPAAVTNGAVLVGILKKIMPRLYSIASSPNAHPGEVHLCVGAVRYTSRERQRGGVCSTYMSDRVQPGDKARVFIHSNKNFRLPEDGATPIIMVGPGTGIAPFRSFWEERCTSGATGRNWLFFGNPYKATDFCYEEEVTKLEQEGKLRLSIAWSRDQAEKIYVQHLMEKNGEEIWQWLQEGACIYVCGDASRMAKDVDAALHKITEIWGGLSSEDAMQFVADMKAAKRYQRDIY